MRKIATPQDLQAEIGRILAVCSAPKPSRAKLAEDLRSLANRLGAEVPLPELAELGDALDELPYVQKWKPIADGIDVYVKGEPIFVEWSRGKGYQRVDFDITVPLGRTVREAVRAFGQMIAKPWEELESEYGRQRRYAGRWTLPRSSYLPAHLRDQEPIVPEGTDMAVWTWEEGDKLYGIAFAGKAQKPLWYHRFRDEGQRQRQIEETAASRRSLIQRTEERAKERREFEHGAKKGDIFYSSWGYDQTNVDFYEVTAVKGKMVVVREIGGKVVRESTGADYVVATPGRFVGEPLKRRPQPSGSRGSYIKINNVQTAWPWDGKPKYQTASGWGH